jgi:hypothetical protein
MREPPAILDSCQVLVYALVDEAVTYTGKSLVFHDGRKVDPALHLAIALNLFEDDFLLCRCNDVWDVLGVSGHTSLDEARHSAERAYRGISAKWVAFRELTAEERRGRRDSPPCAGVAPSTGKRRNSWGLTIAGAHVLYVKCQVQTAERAALSSTVRPHQGS